MHARKLECMERIHDVPVLSSRDAFSSRRGEAVHSACTVRRSAAYLQPLREDFLQEGGIEPAAAMQALGNPPHHAVLVLVGVSVVEPRVAVCLGALGHVPRHVVLVVAVATERLPEAQED
eukprot:7287708-Alexandrium_andersonii.AAC.1